MCERFELDKPKSKTYKFVPSENDFCSSGENSKDIIPKWKINKAIKEINDMAYIAFCAEPLGNKMLVFKDDVLEIIKRNIEEEV